MILSGPYPHGCATSTNYARKRSLVFGGSYAWPTTTAGLIPGKQHLTHSRDPCWFSNWYTCPARATSLRSACILHLQCDGNSTIALCLATEQRHDERPPHVQRKKLSSFVSLYTELREALAALRQAVRNGPKHLLCWQRIGSLTIEGNYQESIPRSERQIKPFPPSATERGSNI